MSAYLLSDLLPQQELLRRHVNIFVEEERIADRRRLSDPVQAHSRIFIMQALSGG